MFEVVLAPCVCALSCSSTFRMVMILVCSDLFHYDLIFYHLEFWQSTNELEALRIDDRRLATLVLNQIRGTCGLVSHINVG